MVNHPDNEQHLQPTPGDDPSPDTTVKRRRWLRRLLYLAVALPVMLIMLLALVTSGPVLRLVLPKVEKAVSTAIHGSFTAGELHGNLWSGLTIDHLALASEESGLSIDARHLHLAWSPLALFAMTIQVDQLSADSLSITLPRSGTEQVPEDTPDTAGSFSLPLALQLGELKVSEFHLVDPASDRQFSFAITGSMAVERDLSTHLALDFLPLTGSLDRLQARLAYSTDEENLKIDIDGRFPRDGLLMTLAGLPPEQATDVTIGLHGDGPVAQWRGDLQFDGADWARLTAELGLQADDEQLGFSLSGTAETPTPATTGAKGANGDKGATGLPEPLQGRLEFSGAGSYALETHQLSLSAIELDKPDLLNLSGHGTFDLDGDRLAADLQLKIDPAASRLLDAGLQWQDLALTLHAEGKPAMVAAELSITGRSLTIPAVTIGEISLDASTTVGEDQLAVDLQGAVRDTTWNDGTLADMLGDRLDLTANADIASDFSKVVIDRLQAATDGLHLTGRAELDGHGRVTVADLTADVADLSIFSSISGMQLGGTGRVAVTNGSWGPEKGGVADIEVTTAQLALGQPDLERLIGPQPTIGATLRFSPQQDLAITLERLQTAMADGAIAIDFTRQFQDMQIKGELAVEPGGVPPGAGVTLEKTARLNVDLAGPPAAPAGDIKLVVSALDAGDMHFDNLTLDTAMGWRDGQVLSFANQLDFSLHQQRCRLQADLLLPPDRLQLDLHLEGKALDLAGQLELPEYSIPATGNISLARLDNEFLGELGVPLAADRLTATVNLRADRGGQEIKFAVDGEGLLLAEKDNHKPNSIEQLQLRGTIADALEEPVITAELNTTGIVFGPLRGERLQAGFNGPVTELHAKIEATGRVREELPVKLATMAVVAQQEDLHLAVDKLDLDIGTQRIALLEPLELTRSAAGELAGLASLKVGTGRLDTKLRLVPNQTLIASADLRDLQLAPWSAMFSDQEMVGTLALNARFDEQAGHRPKAQLTVAADGIRFTDTAGLPPLRLRLDSVLNAKNVTADLELSNPDQQLLQLEAAVPVDLSLLAGRVQVQPRAPLSAQAEIDTDISRFWPYMPLPDHALAGHLTMTARLSGSLENPDWDGALHLENGRYEHLLYGTLLRNLAVDGRFDRQGLHITKIVGDDGASGSLEGKADVEMGEESALSYSATMTMHDMAITRMDELQLWTDIDLEVTGDAHTAEIDSQVTVDRGEVDLAVALPPSVPELEVDNLPGEKQKNQKEEGEEQSPPFTANLAVTVDIPGRLFVRGKGLDSEWGGRLDITGPAANPQIKGELHSRRGQLDVIGKDFAIRGSRITFTGGQPIEPLLDITGVHTTDQLVVKASLTGPASLAKLTLSSEPSLPQDEILSRMMFGKSQGNLSAVEAIQLASAASSLLGMGGNLDIVGSLRRYLGMDVLRVEGGAEGPSLQVGKYLAEGLYVGTKQGTTAGSTGVVVEIELTPKIKVTNESNDLGTKTGIHFKYDY